MTQTQDSDNIPTIITDSELEELQAFLLSDAVPEGTMQFDALDGFLTALAIGPAKASLDSWLPMVWDVQERRATPAYKSVQQSQRINELLMKMMAHILVQLTIYPDYYEPLPALALCESEEIRDLLIKFWATGFMAGVYCNHAEWEPLVENEKAAELLLPIYVLAGPHDITPPVSPELFDMLKTRIPDFVIGIKEFWEPLHSREIARAKGVVYASEADRIGRNEPCPCGSGKKFKKCCGK
ncbi:MAG: UPF0149 family protein [Chlorobium sp.]